MRKIQCVTRVTLTIRVTHRVLCDLQRSWLSRRRMIWLLPLPALPSSFASKLSLFLNLPVCRRSRLLMGEGGVGSKSYDSKKAWSSIMEMWMRSSLVVRASDCQCRSCNSPGLDPSILQHSGIRGAADEAVLNTAHRKNNSFNNLWLHTRSSIVTTAKPC